MEKRSRQGDGQDGEEAPAAMDQAGEASSAAPLLPAAHPCSLLRYVVEACAACLLLLCGDPCSDRGDGDDDSAPAPAAQDYQADGGGNGKTDEEDPQIGHQLLARRRKPRPQRPGNPREGRGGGGGSHN